MERWCVGRTLRSLPKPIKKTGIGFDDQTLRNPLQQRVGRTLRSLGKQMASMERTLHVF
jgi:hypothetical protein